MAPSKLLEGKFDLRRFEMNVRKTVVYSMAKHKNVKCQSTHIFQIEYGHGNPQGYKHLRRSAKIETASLYPDTPRDIPLGRRELVKSNTESSGLIQVILGLNFAVELKVM